MPPRTRRAPDPATIRMNNIHNLADVVGRQSLYLRVITTDPNNSGTEPRVFQTQEVMEVAMRQAFRDARRNAPAEAELDIVMARTRPPAFNRLKNAIQRAEHAARYR